MPKRQLVIDLAYEQLNYLEKASNSQLDDKTANAGYGNWTKYGRDLDAIKDFYNGKKNGYPYCDVWYDWLHVTAYGPEVAKRVLCQPSNSLGAGCTFSMRYYKAAGRFGKEPKLGAQIFFGTESESTHTGLVVKFDTNTVWTIEGNTSSAAGVIANGGGVFEKSYPRSYGKIAGYGYPLYDEDLDDYTPPAANNTNTTTQASSTSYTPKSISVSTWQLSVGAKGPTVTTLQRLLIAKGYDCGKYKDDGHYGDATKAAVVKFQKDHKLEPDGVAGKITWSELINT